MQGVCKGSARDLLRMKHQHAVTHLFGHILATVGSRPRSWQHSLDQITTGSKPRQVAQSQPAEHAARLAAQVAVQLALQAAVRTAR